MFELDPSKFPESPIAPTMIIPESFPQTDQFSEDPTQMSGIPMRYVDELLRGYKVFGPHLETNKDVSMNSEDRYFHLRKKYSFHEENLNQSYGFRFYVSLNDCYKEFNSMPLARICEVYVLGKVVGEGKQFRTNDLIVMDEIKNPFKQRHKKVAKPVNQKPNPTIY